MQTPELDAKISEYLALLPRCRVTVRELLEEAWGLNCLAERDYQLVARRMRDQHPNWRKIPGERAYERAA